MDVLLIDKSDIRFIFPRTANGILLKIILAQQFLIFVRYLVFVPRLIMGKTH